MSIEKKSLISTLKTTKKANVAKEDFSHAGTSVASVKSPIKKQMTASRAPATLKNLPKMTSKKIENLSRK
jgi:hypothetical protein